VWRCVEFWDFPLTCVVAITYPFELVVLVVLLSFFSLVDYSVLPVLIYDVRLFAQ